MWFPLPVGNTTILIGFAVLLFLHFLFVSKSRLFIDMVAVYATLFLLWMLPLFIPFVATLFSTQPLARVIFFFVVVGLLHIILWRSNLHEPSTLIRPVMFVTSIIYRVAVVGLFVTTIVYLLPEAFRGVISGWVGLMFASYAGLLIWLLLPALLAFTYRFHAKNGWF